MLYVMANIYLPPVSSSHWYRPRSQATKAFWCILE